MNIQEKLYPFQREDVEFITQHPRCINGNVMGLGKTVEAMAVMQKLNTRHNLIVCNKTMVPEWWYQINTWLGEDCLTPHDDSKYVHRLSGLDLAGPRFVAINYDILINSECAHELRKVKWDVIIFDEAHHLKNPKAKRTQSAFLLTPFVPRIILMTGTPVQNSPADLFPLFHIINPSEYNNAYRWNNWFCIYNSEEIWMKDHQGVPHPRIVRNIIPGATNNEELLNQLLHLHMVRHEKHEILTQLPPKQYRIVPVNLGREATQYKQMEDEYFAILDSGESIYAPKAVAQMTRLRQICLDPNLLSTKELKTSTPSAKTQTLLNIIEDADDKIVVYTYFEQYARLLGRELESKKIPYTSVTGKIKGLDRLRAVKTFQEDPTVKVILCTIGAGGESITLTSSHTCVFTDVFWNPSVNEQCEDRLYGRMDKGINQNRGALIIDLYCQDTVEQHVHKVVRRKEKMIERIVMRKVVDSMRESRTGKINR